MPERILVAYASNSGSTGEVAKVVGTELAHDGAQVDVRPISELSGADLTPYDAVVVGAPMILGWHRDAERFVKANRAALSRVPVAFFVTLLSLVKTDAGTPASVPLYVDPKLAKSPRAPGRLSLKERFATLGNYLAPILKSTGSIKPVSIAFFGGKLDMGRLKFLQMLFIMVIVGATPGDYRNWDAIRGWARELAVALAERVAHH